MFLPFLSVFTTSSDNLTRRFLPVACPVLATSIPFTYMMASSSCVNSIKTGFPFKSSFKITSRRTQILGSCQSVFELGSVSKVPYGAAPNFQFVSEKLICVQSLEGSVKVYFADHDSC